MDVLHWILRTVVLALSIPFGLLAAVIPGYTAGRIIAAIGLPAEIGYYLVGGIVVFLFCAYFQGRITPPKSA